MLSLLLSLFICFSTQENDHRYDGYRRVVQELTLSHKEIIPINTPYFVLLWGRDWLIGERDDNGCTVTIGREGQEHEMTVLITRGDIIYGLFEKEAWQWKNSFEDNTYFPFYYYYYVLYDEQGVPIVEFDSHLRVYNSSIKKAKKPLPEIVERYLFLNVILEYWSQTDDSVDWKAFSEIQRNAFKM